MSNTDGALNLIDLVKRFPTADAARTYLESQLWPAGPSCPHCGVVGNAAKLEGARCRPGLYKCRDCRKQFTVTVGTIFEDSKIGLDKWMIAIALYCASKKSLSALQLSRMLNLSYKSAWHMGHRIRHALQNGNFKKLDGVVEVDETYVGGKAKNAHNGAPVPVKTPVVSLISRTEDRMKAVAVTDVNHKTIGAIMKKYVMPSAEIFTDGGTHFPQAVVGFNGHETVNHDAKEYVRGVVHIQNCESFNALVKRSIMGAWHSVSTYHLPKYINEVAFRWDYRKVSDSERTAQAIRQTAGCRLTYRALQEVSSEQQEASASA
jgi:transposase-like protein